MKRMNLLPEDLRAGRGGRFGLSWPEVRDLARTGWLLIVVLLFLTSMAAGQGISAMRYRSKTEALKKELRTLRVSSTQLKAMLQEMNVARSDLDQKRRALEERRRALSKASRPSGSFAGLLVEMVGLIPKEVWITKLALQEDRLKLLGVSKSTESVTDLMARMNASRWFRDTTFAYTQRDDKESLGEFRFEVSTTPVLEKGQGV